MQSVDSGFNATASLEAEFEVGEQGGPAHPGGFQHGAAPDSADDLTRPCDRRWATVRPETGVGDHSVSHLEVDAHEVAAAAAARFSADVRGSQPARACGVGEVLEQKVTVIRGSIRGHQKH